MLSRIRIRFPETYRRRSKKFPPLTPRFLARFWLDVWPYVWPDFGQGFWPGTKIQFCRFYRGEKYSFGVLLEQRNTVLQYYLPLTSYYFIFLSSCIFPFKGGNCFFRLPYPGRHPENVAKISQKLSGHFPGHFLRRPDVPEAVEGLYRFDSV